VAHTNIEFFVANGRSFQNTQPSGTGETPASLACIYGLAPHAHSCEPSQLTAVAHSGSKAVAIVDAYDAPTALNDLKVFSKQYGLPGITNGNFKVVYAGGSKPAADPTGGWEAEEDLDIEMVHAFAPKAKIILVEAADDSFTSLQAAELVAIKEVQAAGGGEVSNSWGSSEFSGEGAAAANFTGNKVVVFASSGDSPAVSSIAALPNVVGVGGTSISRSNTGAYLGQTTWDQGGGGISSFIGVPSFQKGTAPVEKIVGKFRGTPDIALIANPDTGVWFYDTTPFSGQTLDWAVIGGTSVASPLAAALVNSAGSFAASTADELTTIYANLGNKKAFSSVTQGNCTTDARGHAVAGYDLCTGVGTPLGITGK
jgi:subtilase family serine protease